MTKPRKRVISYGILPARLPIWECAILFLMLLHTPNLPEWVWGMYFTIAGLWIVISIYKFSQEDCVIPKGWND